MHLCRVILAAGSILYYLRESYPPPPPRPCTLSTTCCSESICFSSPLYPSTCLPFRPRAEATHFHLFSSLSRLLTPLAINDYSLPLFCRNRNLFTATPSDPASRAQKPVSCHGRRHLAAQPAILCAAQGKGSRLSGGTGFDSLSANWAMLL